MRFSRRSPAACPSSPRPALEAPLEILANGAHGMLVPPDDVAAMTTALDAMLSTPELREAYASKARARRRKARCCDRGRPVARCHVGAKGLMQLGQFVLRIGSFGIGRRAPSPRLCHAVGAVSLGRMRAMRFLGRT